MPKYSLVILSNYKYEDLWPISIHYLKNNWPEIYANTFIVTDNVKEKHLHDIKTIVVPTDSFSQRVFYALKEIESDFIVLILDDYFITKRINNEKIDVIVKFMDGNNVDYVRLFEIPKQKKKKMIPNMELYKLDLDTNYAINLQPGVWRKSSLSKISEEDMNPWQFEVYMHKLSIDNNYICYATLGKELPFEHGLLRGKFFRKTYRKVKKDGLLKTNRKKLTLLEEAKYKTRFKLSLLIPKKTKSFFKRILKKFGFKFYTD